MLLFFHEVAEPGFHKKHLAIKLVRKKPSYCPVKVVIKTVTYMYVKDSEYMYCKSE